MTSIDKIDTVSTNYANFKIQNSSEDLPKTKMIEEQKYEDASTVALSV